MTGVGGAGMAVVLGGVDVPCIGRLGKVAEWTWQRIIIELGAMDACDGVGQGDGRQ